MTDMSWSKSVRHMTKTDAGMCQPCVYLTDRAGRLWCVIHQEPQELAEVFCRGALTISDAMAGTPWPPELLKGRRTLDSGAATR